jgi:hypothetical protein
VNPALAAAVEALEAERLAPVPRASRTAAVDVDDLALVLEHVQAASAIQRTRNEMRGEVTAAYQRLDQVVRCHGITDGTR